MANDTTSTRTIVIKVDAKGSGELKEIANQMGGLNRRVKELGLGFSSFKNIFQNVLGFSIAGVGIKTLTDVSDSMQNLENRISVLGGGATKATETMQGLLQAANETKTSIDGLATIYVRLAASTKESNISSTSLLQVSKLLQNTFRLSGATTQEATNASIQLAQGFASGQLRGQELRSVLEQNVVAGDLLAASIEKITGVKGRGGLYKFAEQGKLTSGIVLKALVAGMDETNAKAEQLGQTFEQTLTLATNKFKVAINDLNKEFNLSGQFAKGVDVTSSKLSDMGDIFTAVLAPAFKGMIGVLERVGISIKDVFVNIPFVRPFYEAAEAASYFSEILKDLDGNVLQLEYSVLSFIDNTKKKFEELFPSLGAASKLINKILGGDESKNALKDVSDRIEKNYKTLAKQKTFEEQVKLDQRQSLDDDLNKLKSTEEVIDKRVVLLKKLNKEYEEGSLTVSEYFDRLEEVDKTEAKRLFKEGKKDVEQYNEALKKFDMSSLNRDLAEGYINLQQFNDELEANQLGALQEKFDSGKISLAAYDAELVNISSKFEAGSAFRTGTEDYIKSVGTLSSGIAGAVTKTFTRLEDSLVEFTKTGKFNFQEFTQAILDDLTRIIIRSQIIAPLAKGLLGAISPGASGDISGFGNAQFGEAAFQAKGGAWQNGVQRFASGGIVSSPTSFGMAGGKSGLMGEAGPEAILPLTRTSSGELGVQATQAPVFINIVNNSGSTVDQKESTGSNGERQIDILINAKVKEGIESGRFDRTFDQAYGLKRKGN